MSSKYAISGKPAPRAPRSPAKQQGYYTEDDRSRDIIQGIVEREKIVAELRKEQDELRDQLTRQRAWLNTARPEDPLWTQRCQIHQDRLAQDRDIEQRLEGIFEMQNAQIESLEEPNRTIAIQRLLQWTEPPFVAALFVALTAVLS